ncbi:MAG: BamA/TamA family outer membrane protein [Proteobacteria bacterium]|nr:BamA/TamA family outer membrane protein [Pseudomonadota bacterium]
MSDTLTFAGMYLRILVAAVVLCCGAPLSLAADAVCDLLNTHISSDLTVYEFDTATDVAPLAGSYQLGTVTIVRQNIFQSEERWYEGLANRFHVVTRDHVLASILPFTKGDTVDQRLLDEAERILRAKPYLFDARIITRQICGDRLDLDVVVRDVWTLNPRISLSRSGGENQTSLGIGDINLLGFGKRVDVGYRKNEDRSGFSMTFEDPNIANTRWTGHAIFSDNDDGDFYRFGLERPFYALDAHTAGGGRAEQFERIEPLYFLGERLDEFGAESRSASVYAGFSNGIIGTVVNRWVAGLRYQQEQFDYMPGYAYERAEDRKYVYPFVGYERIKTVYVKRENLDRIKTLEDVNLGSRLNLTLGWSAEQFGGKGDHLVADGSYSKTAIISDRQIVSVNAWLDGFYDLDTHDFENLYASAVLSYHFNQRERLSFFARASYTYADGLTPDQQLLLGGLEGLRGYPNRYQAGDRRFLVTLEQRYYSDIYPFQMFRLGAALFADIGRAWFVDDRPEWHPGGSDDPFGVLTDVGIGLRMESTRTRRDRVLHFDVAFPLNDGPGVRSVEVTITAKSSL